VESIGARLTRSFYLSVEPVDIIAGSGQRDVKDDVHVVRLHFVTEFTYRLRISRRGAEFRAAQTQSVTVVEKLAGEGPRLKIASARTQASSGATASAVCPSISGNESGRSAAHAQMAAGICYCFRLGQW